MYELAGTTRHHHVDTRNQIQVLARAATVHTTQLLPFALKHFFGGRGGLPLILLKCKWLKKTTP